MTLLTSLFEVSLQIRMTFAQMSSMGWVRTRKRCRANIFTIAGGSALFEQICELEEYYPTSTENALIRERAEEISSLVGPGTQIVEPGSGSIDKVRLLLDALDDPGILCRDRYFKGPAGRICGKPRGGLSRH